MRHGRPSLVHLAALGVSAVLVLASCGGGDDTDGASDTTAAPTTTAAGGKVASGSKSCPPEADVTAAVGVEVKAKSSGMTCLYEASGTSVSITTFGASEVDQLRDEMRSAAAPYQAAVESIQVGERGYAWAGRGQGAALGVAGGDARYVELTGGPGDTKAALLKVLQLVV